MQGAMCLSRTEEDGDYQDHIIEGMYSRGAFKACCVRWAYRAVFWAHIMGVSH